MELCIHQNVLHFNSANRYFKYCWLQLHAEMWARDFLIFLFTIKHFTSLFAHRKNPLNILMLIFRKQLF